MKDQERARLEEVQREWLSAANILADALDTTEGDAPDEAYEDEGRAWEAYLAVCAEYGVCTTRHCTAPRQDGEVLCGPHKASFDTKMGALLGGEE